MQQHNNPITGYYGCKCHPFESWDQCEAAHKYKPVIGQEARHRCSGLVGVVHEILSEKGFITVKYGSRQSDIHLEHVANMVFSPDFTVTSLKIN